MVFEWSAFRSRLARRLAVSFVICAVVPFLLVGALGYVEISALADRRSAERLQEFASAYGMFVIGQLTNADSLLRALLEGRATSDELNGESSRYAAFRELRHVAGAEGPPSAPGPVGLPWPSAPQRRALAQERSVLLADGQREARRVFLVRASPRTGTWVYAQLDPEYLWASPDARLGAAGVIVAARDGHLLHVSERMPKALLDRIPDRGLRERAGQAAASVVRTADGEPWQTSRWEVFLEGAFAAPSWQVIATAPRVSAFAQLGRLQVLFPGLLAATLCATLLFAVWRIRRYFEPLEQLLAGTRRLSRREFDAVVKVASDDEVGELALSFNAMATSLKKQFEALEAMSEVDRLLLRSPGLEQVLDALLPRIAALLECRTVSVLLVDADAPGHARVYDFGGRDRGALPVRRVALDAARIDATLGQTQASHATLRADGPESPEFLAPLADLGATLVSIWLLQRGEQLAGLMCLGFDSERWASDGVRISRAREFADRLAVVLANVQHEQALYRKAHYDPLTELPNRALFRDRLGTEIASVASGGAGVLLYIDLDHFKRVNDTAGHGTGDELLRIVGQRIVECVKDGDTVARLGGDEFAVVLRHVTDPLAARGVADRILGSLSQPVNISGRDYYVTASIGVTLFPNDGHSIEELLKNSDIAMYRAKEAGRGRAVFFEPGMNARMLARAALETGLHRALRQSQFEIHYQPIVVADTATLGGVEALLRWPLGPPDFALPATFIPAAEESGLIVELGDWVLDTACRTLATWLRRGMRVGYVAVNVSPRQLREADFPDRVRAALERHALEPQMLRLEITESVLADAEFAGAALARLTKMRVGIALDDFGTGYSSLSYLRRYPIDVVKIDRSFIQDVPGSDAACTLVDTIIAMAHALRKTVVAEGVETLEQLQFLRSRGCDGVQGYFLARPMRSEELERRALERAPAPEFRWAS